MRTTALFFTTSEVTAPLEVYGEFRVEDAAYFAAKRSLRMRLAWAANYHGLVA